MYINPLLNSNATSAINARKITCINGHELSGDNLRIKKQKDGIRRQCRTCIRQAKKRRAALAKLSRRSGGK